MRLIDADEVKKLLTARYEGAEYIEKDIDRIPTAYNVEKVVEQLEHDAQMLYSINAFEPVKAWRNDLLIPVVKGGLEE
jgi:hypothetical protein